MAARITSSEKGPGPGTPSGGDHGVPGMLRSDGAESCRFVSTGPSTFLTVTRLRPRDLPFSGIHRPHADWTLGRFLRRDREGPLIAREIAPLSRPVRHAGLVLLEGPNADPSGHEDLSGGAAVGANAGHRSQCQGVVREAGFSDVKRTRDRSSSRLATCSPAMHHSPTRALPRGAPSTLAVERNRVRLTEDTRYVESSTKPASGSSR